MQIKKFIISIVVVVLLVIVLPAYAQVINAGVGGNTTSDLLKRIDKDVLDQNPDLVILMVGTNDMLNSRKMLSYQEYESNLDKIASMIIANGSQLIIMSSPTVDSAYLFTRHDRTLFTETPNEKIDAVGKIVATMAKQLDAYFFDLNEKFKELNLPQHNQDLFINNQRNSGRTDGVHPTALGYQFIAESVFFFLKENELLEPEKKIICFGDSITKGGELNENYPSYLAQRIDNYSTKTK